MIRAILILMLSKRLNWTKYYTNDASQEKMYILRTHTTHRFDMKIHALPSLAEMEKKKSVQSRHDPSYSR